MNKDKDIKEKLNILFTVKLNKITNRPLIKKYFKECYRHFKECYKKWLADENYKEMAKLQRKENKLKRIEAEFIKSRCP
jgi:uncharacterized membrane protein (DUF106 family)